MPITIDGKPFSTSSQSRICCAAGRGANSLTKIAVRTPIGRAMSVATPTRSSEPASAGAMPPLAAEEVGARALDEEVEVDRADAAAAAPTR